jgi:hypothetical protein
MWCDRLVFVGAVGSVVDLRKVRGLAPATNQIFKLEAPRSRRCLIEAVVSPECPLIGRTIREGGFRTEYGAPRPAASRWCRPLPGCRPRRHEDSLASI